MQPASKLSYLDKGSEPRENARARGRGTSRLRRSLARFHAARFARPNMRACSQANIYGTSIIQQAWLHRELEPTGSILSVPSTGSLYDFKPVLSVVISKRTRSTIGYGIFDEYLDLDHKRFYFGVCSVVLLRWFRVDSYVCDGQKS